MQIANIFVVYDPTRETQPAFDRAVGIAGAVAAKLQIFACIYADTPRNEDRPARIRSLLAAQKAVLDNIAAPLLARGIQATTEVEWDKDWYQAVVRASVRNGADVVLKSSFRHSAGQRVLNRTSDWTLIRECLCPVLLVKEGSSGELRKVLAAIDLRDGGDDYATLNRHIVEFSRKVVEGHNAEVHFINAFQSLHESPDRNALMKYCGVSSDRIHIQLGEPEDVIVNSARDLNAGLVVVGNSARSGLAAIVRGNTVEKVLDKLECDILSMP